MPLVQTRGAASAQGFGEFAQASPVIPYIEDVFSCFLYTGTGAAQTITNGIDLSTKGGLVWTKSRSNGFSHQLVDTVRGVTKALLTNATVGEQTETTGLTAFGTTGYTYGSDGNYNGSGFTYVSWTFRKQPKFFDVVTYTGTGSIRTVAHNLGSVPGCMIIKQTNASGEYWGVYHRSLGATKRMYLNTTAAEATNAAFWDNTAPTSTEFTVGAEGTVNSNGGTYVAYLFAHDAGGFGLSGTDNVISCGSFTTVSSAATVNLGYEPQWILWKRTDSAQNWNVYDNMRGLAQTKVAQLYPNLVQVEDMYAATSSSFPAFPYLIPTATGFKLFSAFGLTGSYIYIAIRRGPMKTPTDATKVFSPQTATYTANQVVTTNFVTDMVIQTGSSAVTSRYVADRLRGVDTNFNSSDPTSVALFTNQDVGESAGTGYTNLYTNTSYRVSGGFSGFPSVNWNFSRAPGFFDIVCYTGTGNSVVQNVTHNLGVVPDMTIIKSRISTGGWLTMLYNVGGFSWTLGNFMRLELTNGKLTNTAVIDTNPTASIFNVPASNSTNNLGEEYVVYLFATLAGVSKVGSYTGNGSTQTIACGFTGGSRFVLIKRTDAAGDWYVWDSARGIIAGNDPHLSLNDTAAQVTSDDSLDTDNTGFIVNQVAATDINVTSAAYIFYAIA